MNGADVGAVYDEPAAPSTGVVVDAAAPPEGTPKEPLGFLLDETDPKKVVEHVERRLWKAQDKRVKRFDARWTANEYVVDGVTGVRVVEDADQASVRVYVPLGATAQRHSMPKTDQLLRKITATLLVDPPLPEATPSTGEDRARSAAELSTRLLRDEASESGVNLRADLETAENLAGVYGSGFTWVTVNPQGAGWRPMEVQAHPEAQRYDDADPDAVAWHPETGEPAAGYVTRYVGPDGTLQRGSRGARKVWRPALEHRSLTGRHVRFLPETAAGIRDALGVVICQVQSLGSLKATFPDDAKAWTDYDLKALVDWRPAPLAKILPPGVIVEGDGKPTENGKYTDDALCMTLSVYYKSHAAYPEGAYVVVGGGRLRLHKQTWTAEVDADGGPATDADADTARTECLDLPVAQCRQLNDRTGGNPYGLGMAQKLGPGDDLRATQLAAWVEFLYRFNHANVFLPMGSIVQPRELARRDGTPIFFNPEGKPEYEQVPNFPAEAIQLYETAGAEMNSESGLEETAQGVDTDTARSGIAKQLVVEQALTALSGIKQNAEDYFTRLCRIDLQMYRAYFDTAQLLRYAGEDGGHRLREWTRSDLGSTRDVRIARGSFTLLSRSAKQALARDELAIGLQWQDPAAYARYQRIQLGTVDPVLGIEDDPHRLRIRGQISRWGEGAQDAAGQQAEGVTGVATGAPQPPPLQALPTDNGAAPMAPDAPAVVGMGQPVPDPANPGLADPAILQPGGVDPATGQPAPAAPVADPQAVACFAPLPVDEEPEVAKLRHDELARAMAGSRYQTAPPAWRVAFDAEYLRMRQAAGVQTVAEQQAAQQVAAQQQAAQQQAQGAAQRQSKAADHQAATERQDAQLAHASGEKAADRDAAAARDAHRTEAQQAAAQQRAQMQAAVGTPA